MALPTTPASQWIRELDRPFGFLEGSFDDYELYEEDDEFVLTIDLPGYDPADISVAWDDGLLNVAADHVDDERGREKTYHRRFRFPKDVDDESITAEYRNGVLEITLPLMEDAVIHGREIPVET